MEGALHHELLLAFDTDGEEFVRGFEVGRLWMMLREFPDMEVEETLHASNAEMLLRLAEATKRHVRTRDLDPTWVTATFSAVKN